MSVCVMMIISIMNGGQSAPINQPFKLIIEFLKHTFIKAFCAFNISASTTLCMSELIISHYAFAAVVITFVYRKHTKKLGNYCSMKVLSSRLPGVWSASRRRSSNPICLIVKKKTKNISDCEEKKPTLQLIQRNRNNNVLIDPQFNPKTKWSWKIFDNCQSTKEIFSSKTKMYKHVEWSVWIKPRDLMQLKETKSNGFNENHSTEWPVRVFYHQGFKQLSTWM